MIKKFALFCAAIFMSSLATLLLPGVALGATIYVGAATCPAVGAGTFGNPYCSIQTAVNNATAGDTIVIAAGTFMESVVISKNLTLQGASAATTLVTGDGNNPAIKVTVGVTVVVKSLAASGASADVNGGGFHNSGTLTLPDVAVTGNSATGNGGGIYNANTGVLVMERGSLNGNSADLSGGAIFNAVGGSVTLSGVAITGNSDQNGLAIVGVVTAKYSWWNHTSGPGGSGPGLGDKVGASVAFTPWKTASTDRLLNTSAAGAGTGTVSPSGVNIYANGTTVSLTATPTGGSTFGGWSGDCAGSVAGINVAMSADKACVATFISVPVPSVPPPGGPPPGGPSGDPPGWGQVTEFYSLKVEAAGCGSVKADPDQRFYREKTPVNLAALPDKGCRFVGWNMSPVNNNHESITVEMDADKSIKAVFEPIVFTLTVLPPRGEGIVYPSPGVYIFPLNEVVIASFQMARDQRFVRWEGGVVNSDSVVTAIVMNRDMVVQAVAASTTHALAIRLEGEGLVDPLPGVYSRREGESTVLYAFPPAGYECQWDGPVAHRDRCATYAVMGRSDATVTARFVPPLLVTPHAHSLTTETMGEGIVILEPNASRYSHNARVLLTAAPRNGWWFDRWVMDGLEGSFSPRITITLREDRRVIAVFRPWEDWWLPY